MTNGRSHFSRYGFILAAAGSAIGLGNIWKFPYITYEQGGGSFVLVYLAAILLIGAPIMIAEITIGRHTQQSPVGAFLDLAKGVFGGKIWSLIGWLGIAGGFVILSYYSVVAGWTVYYFGQCLSWSANGFTEADATALGQNFGAFLGKGGLQVTFHGIFMLLTVGVVIMGIKGGIERVTKILMPVLFTILVILVINATTTAGFGEAFTFLFSVTEIDADSLLEAVGHSFFTLSLGMGAMITYGSYVDKKDSIPKSAATICFLDTLIAIMACIIMFSIIFSIPEAQRGDTFSKSATILFTTLPQMFYSMPGGSFLSPLFFLLVAFAALTSTISLMEVVVSYFIDRLKWSRIKSTLIVGALIFGTGICAALSLGANETLTNLQPFGDKSQGVFDSMDYFASNWMLPVGGFFIALFTGWFLSQKLSRDEIEEGHGPYSLHKLWIFLLRFVCPVAIGWIIYTVIAGTHKFN